MISERRQIEALDNLTATTPSKLYELDWVRRREIEELKKRVDKLESELEQCTNKK